MLIMIHSWMLTAVIVFTAYDFTFELIDMNFYSVYIDAILINK